MLCLCLSCLGVNNVIKQSEKHILGETALEVRPYYVFLENTARNKSEITCDPDVFDYIQENHESELRTVLNENKMELSLDNDTSIATVSSSEKKKDSYSSWKERTGRLESFLQSFKKDSISIPSEICDEIAQRWEEQSSSNGRNVLVSFRDNKRLAQIIGKNKYVEKEKNSLQELIHEVAEDTELMKSIVEVLEDGIPKSRLTLLQMSGICEKLQSEHQHLSIAFEENGQKLLLKGPRILLQEVRPVLLAFTSRVIEQTVPLRTNIVNVLKRTVVSDFTQGLLKQRDMQALFVYDQTKTPNEVQVVGVDSKSVEEATEVLQNAIQERSLHLTNENAVVLESRSWNDFHSELTSKFKVGIFTECPSNTVCVSGIAEDVKECFEQVKQFLDANTILHHSLPMDQGTTRFIVEKWRSKLDGIKKDLATCFLEMKTASNYDGIEVSGTAEGLEKCLPRLEELVKAVQKDSIPIDKPGIKKFILQGKGPELLKAVEVGNQFVILVKERKEKETPLREAGAEEFSELGVSPPVLKSSYGTKEGEKSSALKSADGTVHRKTMSIDLVKPKLATSDGGVNSYTVEMRETPRSLPGIRITVKKSDLSQEKVIR